MLRILRRIGGIQNPIKNLFAEAQLASDIRRSLYFIMVGNVCGTLCSAVCGTGTNAMISLANELGAGDLVFGILNGLGCGLSLMQIPFAALVEKTHHRKKYMLTFGLFSRALWILAGLIPVLVPVDPAWLPLASLLMLVTLSGISGASINVCWFPWFGDLAPLHVRGRWFSYRDTITSVISVAFGLFISYLLDHLPSPTRFLVVFTIGGVIGVLDMCCFIFCKEVYVSAPEGGRGEITTPKQIFRNKTFIRFLLFWTAWCFAGNLGNSYINRYLINEMSITNMQITIFASITSSLATMLTVRYWGRMQDRFGSEPVMLVTSLVTAAAALIYLSTTPKNVLPMVLYNALGAAFWSGNGLAATNMQLTSTPAQGRATYIAWFSCITSLVGSAFGMVAGGWILEWLAAWCPLDRYKVLITFGAALRISFVLLMVPRMENDREATVRDLIKYMFRKRGLRRSA